MLSVSFCLTYFSTRNSSTQVSASNPFWLFHCSCHHAEDRRRKRRKRGEQGRGNMQAVHMSSPFTCSTFSVRLVRTLILTDSLIVMACQVILGWPFAFRNTCMSTVSSLVEPYACVSMLICGIFIHADVKTGSVFKI